MRYFIEDTTLTAIGDAVRAKSGSNDLIKVSELADAITNLPSGGGGGIEVEPIVLSGNCAYACAGVMAGNYVKLFGNTVSTNNITSIENMFKGYTHDTIPFDINCKAGTDISGNATFYESNIKIAPKLINFKPNTLNSFFYSCKYLREIPDDYDESWDWSYINSYNYGSLSALFQNCYSLRYVSPNFIKNCYSTYTSSYGMLYSQGFNECSSLDEINDILIIPRDLTSNSFTSFVSNCYRLKTLTFKTNDDGTAKTANWKNQTFDLSRYVGYANTWSGGQITDYNSGITVDKRVSDDATYQALKDDPDYWTTNINYSRYNKTSAVNTINSLPDTSAYGTNTIKFSGASGALTDGGAINTLTEEEIAVAAAKGWTVSLS